MINFQDLRIEGFGSITKKLKYKLNNPGLTIIKGQNGAGKSTIFNALFWCLYGQNLKGKNPVAPWPEVLPKDFIGTKVSVTFKKDDDGYAVIRHFEYRGKTMGEKGKNSLVLVQYNTDGSSNQVPFKDKPETQKYLTELLGYSPELFKASLFFGQKLKRLIEEDGPAKKKIFSEIFEIHFIDKARELAQAKREVIRTNHNKVNIEYVKLKEYYKAIKALIANEKENKSIREKERISYLENSRERYVEVSEEIELTNRKISESNIPDSYTTQLAELWDKINLLRDEESRYFKLEMQANGFEAAKERLQTSLNSLTLESLQKTCKVCGSKLSKEKIAQAMSKLKADRKLLKKDIAEIDTKLEFFKNTPKPDNQLEILKLRDIENDINYKVKTLESTQKSLKDTLKRLKDRKDAIGVEITKLEKPLENKLHVLKQERKGIRQNLSRSKHELEKSNKQLSIYNWIIEDPLGNTGIKTYIFKQGILAINQAIRKYAEPFGMEITLDIDLESARKDITISVLMVGAKRKYEEISGGERQLVDLLLAFSCHEVIGKTKGSNILMVDEVFESLDQSNIEIVTRYLVEKSKTQSVHLITHLKDFEQSNSNIIYLLKGSAGETVLE